MTAKTEIFLFTNDGDTVGRVRRISENGSPVRLGGVFSDPLELNAFLEHSDIQAGVFDIDPDPQTRLREMESILQAHPKLCSVVVSETISQDLILSAMQSGARHFIQKNAIGSELPQAVSRLLQHTLAKRPAGRIVTIFSAAGGCGATTVAMNTAMELRLRLGKPVMMIDLDRFYGSAAAYLDIESKYGIADLLSHKGNIDRHLVQSTSTAYMEDFHVLLSPADTAGRHASALPLQNLPAVLEACRQMYAVTVIDAPRLDDEAVKQLSELSDYTVVVFQLTIKDLRCARSIITSFRQRGHLDKIIPLANRFQKRSRLVSVESGRQAIGADHIHLMRSDWRTAMTCLNRGKTLAEAAPRSGMRKDLLKLIDHVNLTETSV
jgi:pilus assembly protein CpaE